MHNYIPNLENYPIDPNATDLILNVHRTGNSVCYETACSTIGCLSTDALILYLHIMQRSSGKGCTLDFGELLRSVPMAGDLLEIAIAELLVEGYLTYTLPEDDRITDFAFVEHPDMDRFIA